MAKLDDRLGAALAGFLRELANHRPRLVAIVLTLMTARSLTEGLSFLLLIPLLGLDGAATPATVPLDTTRGATFLTDAVSQLSPVTLLSLFLAALVTRAALGYASAVANATYLASIGDHVRTRVFGVLARAGWLHLAASRQSVDTRALTGQSDCVVIGAWHVLLFTSAASTLLTGMAVAFMFSPRHTLAVLVAGALLGAPMQLFQRWSYRRGAAASKAHQTLLDVVVERMQGLKLAKAFAIERQQEAAFRQASGELRRAEIGSREIDARATLVQEMMAAILVVVLVYVALTRLKISALELIVLIMIFARLLPLAHSLQSHARSLAALMPDYLLLQRREASAEAAAEPLPSDTDPLLLRSKLSAEAISFAYPGHPATPVVDALSLTIEAGSAVGVLGLSGAGKSTLADILAGLIVPDRGQISVDGVAVDASIRSRWRRGVTYVPQDAPLFYDTLRANLTLAARQASDAEIWHALETVHAAALVRALPDGLETMAGDRGVRLSGGERQRLRLASALLRRPQLLILDESTNALNPDDEAEIINSLQRIRGTMTILLIAHRPSSVAWMDRVVVLAAGRIVADGAPAEVLAAAAPRQERSSSA